MKISEKELEKLHEIIDLEFYIDLQVMIINEFGEEINRDFLEYCMDCYLSDSIRIVHYLQSEIF